MQQILTFFTGAGEYGIPVHAVREIAEAGAVAKVPSAPAWIRGVMNLRGAVVPVVDLAVKLSAPPTVETRRTCLVIVELPVEDGVLPMAVMVDGVRTVIDLDEHAIQPPPSFGIDIGHDQLLGMARVDERLVVLLDITRILTTAETIDAGALHAAGAAS